MNTAFRAALTLGFFAALTLIGCGDDDTTEGCLPGESRACVGAGGCSGGQVCLPDGMSLGECICDDAPDGGQPDASTADLGTTDGGSEQDAGEDIDAFMGPTHIFDARDLVCMAGMTPVCETTEPARSEAERTRTLDPTLDGATLAFVLSALDLPDEGTTRAGFNLDAMDSGDGGEGTCEETMGDFDSDLDPLHLGVDNAYSHLRSVIEAAYDPADCPGGSTADCFPPRALQLINVGDLLLVVELTGVDSLSNDPEVMVSIHLAVISGGSTPALSGDTLAPDQELDTVATVAEATVGDIFDGRLRVRFAAWQLSETIADRLLVFGDDLAGVELRADVGATGLSNGNLGGSTALDDFVATLDRQMPGIEETARAIAEAVADVTPSSDPTICEDLSAGYTFDAVPAIRNP